MASDAYVYRMLLISITYIALAAYALFALLFLIGWVNALWKDRKTQAAHTSASVIIPFRNEAQRISPLIISVKILLQKFSEVEFIFVDDHSDDDSVRLLQEEFADAQQVKIIQLPNGISGKKQAITVGINHAQHTAIITTDADCELTESALNAMLYALENDRIKMACGAVYQSSGSGFGAQLADVEFLSLIGSGISFWGLGFPFMANGAFLGFKKAAFQHVNGFEGHEQYPGGDDVFLLQKMVAAFGRLSVHFLTHANSTVKTQGDASFKAFINRRIRWGAKAKAYPSTASKIVSIAVFFINMLLVVAFASAFMGANWYLFLYAIGTKAALDGIMLSSILLRFQKWRLLPFVLPASVMHPYYILFTATLSLMGKYNWKGRAYGQ